MQVICTALANICQCHPKSSLYIKEVHGCRAFSRALDKMQNSQKTVEALLLSISVILDTSMPGIQEKFGNSKQGQLIVSCMLAYKDVDIIQQTVSHHQFVEPIIVHCTTKEVNSDLLCAPTIRDAGH